MSVTIGQFLVRLLCFGTALLGAFSAAVVPAAEVPPVYVLRINGAIGPAAADQVRRGLDKATEAHAQATVLEIDTPGGLDTAMRSIVKDILAAPMPVVGFVAPRGARAASAGTYILYACHVAAMAPATNLGAATPIAIGLPTPGATPDANPGANPAPPKRPASAASAPEAGPKAGAEASPDAGHDALAAKRVNDASAYIRALAQLRGRNVAWAEQAVREAVSLSASDALGKKVIDLIADDLPDLLRQLDGRVVALGGASAAASVHPARITLATAQARVVVVEPDWRARLLGVISDPSLALLLLMLGVYGLIFEFMNPGAIAPGVIGGLCLLLALWGMQMLPINYAGLALVLLGICFFVAEAFVPSYGALGMGGIAAFALGALLLIDSDVPGFGIPLPLVAGLSLASAFVVIGIASMADRARRRPVVSGTPQLIGALGEVLEFADGQGWALVDGERWQVRADVHLQPRERVRVLRVDGLALEVTPTGESP